MMEIVKRFRKQEFQTIIILADLIIPMCSDFTANANPVDI